MESKVSHSYDAELVLQAVGSVAITATATSSLVGLNLITKGRGDINGRFGEGSFDVQLYVEALDHTTGDETYSLAFETFDASGANGTLQDTVAFTTADVGKVKTFKFSTATLGGVDPDGAQFGIVATLGGTSPSLQYWAYIAPNQRWG